MPKSLRFVKLWKVNAKLGGKTACGKEMEEEKNFHILIISLCARHSANNIIIIFKSLNAQKSSQEIILSFGTYSAK